MKSKDEQEQGVVGAALADDIARVIDDIYVRDGFCDWADAPDAVGTWATEKHGAVVATILETPDEILEIQKLPSGYSLIVHNRHGETDQFEDLSVHLEDNHLRAIGALSSPAPAVGEGWRTDMDIAPKDGTWIAGHTTHHKVLPCRWSERIQGWEICNLKLKLNAWQPLPEPKPRLPIALYGSSPATPSQGE